MSHGMNLIASLLGEDVGKYVHRSLTPDLFFGIEKDIFEFVHGHVCRYGALPARETVEKDFGALPAPPEPVDYYLDHVNKRFVHQGIKKALIAADEMLKQDRAYDAKEQLTSTLIELAMTQHRTRMVDYTQDGAKIIGDEYNQKLLMGDDYGLKMGWPTLDAMTGGLSGGDIVVVSGRPSQGKSFLSLYSVFTAWEQQGKVPLYVSMEMKPLLVLQRLAAIHARKPITKLKTGTLTTKSQKELMQCLHHASTKQPFWVVDGGMAASVQDILLLCHQLRPDVVVIDGAYLVTHSNPKVSNWEKVKGVMEDTKKHIAEGLNLPVIMNYQLSRDAVKKNKDQVAGLEDLAYSDAIGQIASVVLGLLEEDTVETLMRKRVQILKGRSGETGDFWVNWIFDVFGPNGFMDFTECEVKPAMTYI